MGVNIIRNGGSSCSGMRGSTWSGMYTVNQSDQLSLFYNWFSYHVFIVYYLQCVNTGPQVLDICYIEIIQKIRHSRWFF